MISLGDLARSGGAFGAQNAAVPASFSNDVQAPASSVPATVDAGATDRVSISAEAVRQLQHAALIDREQTNSREAAAADANLATRMAHDLAYRREVVVVPPAAYTNLAYSGYLGAESTTSKAANVAKAQAEVDQARMARIAIYELEKAKGTPPAEIYDRLLGLASSQHAGYRITLSS